MRTDLFDFDLPEDRIALSPVAPRDAARLLHVRPGASKALTDSHVRQLPRLLRPGDCLVVNDTRVIPSALTALRAPRARPDSTKIEAQMPPPEPVVLHLNLHKRVDETSWFAFAKPARRLQAGDSLGVFGPGGDATGLLAWVIEKLAAGEVLLRFNMSGTSLDRAISRLGAMPLPPYIAAKRAAGASDRESYQTVYAEKSGAVAAPTAGLHFTPELFAALERAGISRQTVTLHVGAGTFMPVKAEDTGEHHMHAEWGEIDDATAAGLNAVRAKGGRIVAVGTTCLRLLESAAADTGRISTFRGDTDIFITPGHTFRAVDVLMTNFHLPRSTLFMLVSAFAGLDLMKQAYAHAIEQRYRFYSYGDSCLLERA